MPPDAEVRPDLANVQGLIVRGYSHPVSRHFLFAFPSPEAGRGLIAHLQPQVCNAGDWGAKRPECLINFGISFEGLKALQLPANILKEFPADFREPPSAGKMGDVGDSAPDRWLFDPQKVHAVVHLFAIDKATLDDATTGLRAKAQTLGLTEIRPANGEALEGALLPNRRVHFGYRDGLSQPQVDWGDGKGGNVSFRNFVIGYATAEINSRPIGPVGDIFRDSSYAGLRWLKKDVAAFHQFLDSEGPKLAPDRPLEDARELLAAKLLGRWRDGTPLMLSPDGPKPALADANAFGYKDDPNGEKCPVSAHIRIVNPRDEELEASVVHGVPPLIRRGMPFGPELQGAVDDGQLRGLIGIFICVSIIDQFYLLTAWMKNNDFSPLFKDNHRQDPFANRKITNASSEFLIPRADQQPVNVKLTDFSTTLGTAFFLLPSLKAMTYLSEAH